MIVSIQRFQRPSVETPTTATLLYQLHEGPIGESEELRTFRRVLSVLLTSLAILVMTIFTVQSPTITPAALYTAIFFACCTLVCIAMFIVKHVLCQFPEIARGSIEDASTT
ncbi:membrane protein [Chlamydia psittaci]|uniref:membrane protein n=1 Tax=Chlamydia psittaci TaxID=83554 RepID=UPI00059C6649|nr:membrane protein [Chlamydia psittaci]KPZ35763.1 membrane protein [Chlamydia psittaci CP3]